MKQLFYGLFIMACVMVLFGCKKDGSNEPNNPGTDPGSSSSPLCFTARNGIVDVKFDIANVTHTIQYSTDGTNWSTYNSGTAVTINANQSIYFRAESNQTTATAFGIEEGSHFVFSCTDGVTVEGSGNIMSLYGPDCPDLPLQKLAFSLIFEDCTALTTAPSLPATTLADMCYEEMFSGCTALKTAPSLPATTIAFRCYEGMFKGCSALTTTPSLPATTMVEMCYEKMFKDCIALTTAPSLPATALALNCYNYMFSGCTALIAAPSLPATTLAGFCYSYMFSGCTALTTVPSLPATTLASSCYMRMFSGCTSLVINTEEPGTPWQIPSNAASASDWNFCMFYGTGGNFTDDPKIGVTYYIASDVQ